MEEALESLGAVAAMLKAAGQDDKVRRRAVLLPSAPPSGLAAHRRLRSVHV